MATDNATIMGGEDQMDIEWGIVDICGINISEYIEDDTLLTRELVEKNFEEIMKYVKSEYNNYVAHQVLGYIILKTGSNLPSELQNDILMCALWDIEKEFWLQNPRWENPRKFFLKDFKTKIGNHVAGKKTLLEEIYPEDPDYMLG
ncbi:MAG: hypothetical protein E3J90_05605 [Promethearchaeota archaeon]|nr:MAG: hypothetical protein E3J90_05605 [Candidatus Lokiarchaeota archaeon]